MGQSFSETGLTQTPARAALETLTVDAQRQALHDLIADTRREVLRTQAQLRDATLRRNKLLLQRAVLHEHGDHSEDAWLEDALQHEEQQVRDLSQRLDLLRRRLAWYQEKVTQLGPGEPIWPFAAETDDD